MGKILIASTALMLFMGIDTAFADLSMKEFQLPSGSRPHDVAPARDGGVWYTAQRQGALGRLDPATGKVEQIPLGQGSAPHGVIVGSGRSTLDHRWRTERDRSGGSGHQAGDTVSTAGRYRKRQSEYGGLRW